MAIPHDLLPLVQKVSTMIPLYRDKEVSALRPFVANIEQNLKRLESGALPADTWEKSTISDFSNIALLLKKGEAGALFASNFDDEVLKLHPATAKPAEVAAQSPASTTSSPAAAVAAPDNAPASPELFNVRTFLQSKAASAGEKLQWQTSVVDLLKLLGLETSLADRKRIAAQIGLSNEQIEMIGSEDGNETLRTHLVGVLAQNSGKLPETRVA